jgi:hypothetical protein
MPRFDHRRRLTRAAEDPVKLEAGPFHIGHAWDCMRAPVAGFREVESPRFVLLRRAFIPRHSEAAPGPETQPTEAMIEMVRDDLA